jgi:hypothetical protein
MHKGPLASKSRALKFDACGILECVHFNILVRSTCVHYAMEVAYKNDIKQLTNLSTFSFTFTIGFGLGVLHVFTQHSTLSTLYKNSNDNKFYLSLVFSILCSQTCSLIQLVLHIQFFPYSAINSFDSVDHGQYLVSLS